MATRRALLLLVLLPGCGSDSWLRVDDLLPLDVKKVESARWLDVEVQPDEAGTGILVLAGHDVDCDDARTRSFPWMNPGSNFMADGDGLVGLFRWEGGEPPASFEGVYAHGGYAITEDDERTFAMVLYSEGIGFFGQSIHGSAELVAYSRSSVIGRIETDLVQGEFTAEHCGDLPVYGYGY